MLKTTIFWKMKEIHCHLPQTRSAASCGRGKHYTPTPRQLGELQLGVCLSSKMYFSGQKPEKIPNIPDGKAKHGQKFLLIKVSSQGKKRLKPCF